MASYVQLAWMVLLVSTTLHGSMMTADELLLDFDTDATGSSITTGQLIEDEYLGFGVWIDATNHNKPFDRAVTFDTSNPTVNDADLAAPGYGPGNDGSLGTLGKALIVASSQNLSLPDDEEGYNTTQQYSSYIDFFFTQDYIRGSVDLLDIEGAPQTVAHGARIDLIKQTAIVSSFFVNSLGDNGLQRFDFTGSAFDTLRINLTRGGAIDNLHLYTTAIPEPAAFTLLAIGALVFTSRPHRYA